MTWYADQTENRPEGPEVAKLMAKREALEAQLLALRASPVGKSQAAINGRQEDLLAAAKKILIIDKRLGRA